MDEETKHGIIKQVKRTKAVVLDTLFDRPDFTGSMTLHFKAGEYKDAEIKWRKK